MLIKNAKILCDDFNWKRADILFNETILKIEENLQSDDCIDAQNLMLIPGFIDIHSHGCVGFDACDNNLDGYKKMADFYANHGVTSFLFTFMTYPIDMLIERFETANKFIKNNNNTAYSHGFHTEGLYINSCKKGAQAEEYIIPPSIDTFKQLYDASNGNLKLIIVAPETPNALELIEYANDFVSVSIGHTNADYDTATNAFKIGAKSITHTFNAMPPLHHRNTGVIGAALDANSYMELICDGFHSHPSAARIIIKCCDKDKLVLISDSMSAAGMNDGIYDLGGQSVFVDNGKATLEDGTIAGSTTNVLDCVKNCIKFGASIEDAVKAASLNPAKLIGVDNVTGSIAVNKNADFILIDNDFNIKHVFIKGKKFL